MIGHVVVDLVGHRPVDLAGQGSVYGGVHPVRRLGAGQALESGVGGVERRGVVERVVDTLLNLW